jgi:DNA-binding response OmpR family regulator
MRRPAEYREPQLAYQGLQVLPTLGCMQHREEQVSLAPAELQLIILLVRAAGQIVRRSALEAAAWGVSDAVTPNALDVALHRLRKKLGAIGAPLTIVNVRNLGFSLLHADAAA